MKKIIYSATPVSLKSKKTKAHDYFRMKEIVIVFNLCNVANVWIRCCYLDVEMMFFLQCENYELELMIKICILINSLLSVIIFSKIVYLNHFVCCSYSVVSSFFP